MLIHFLFVSAFAVAVNNKIELLTENGTAIKTLESFHKLRAITIDNAREQLIVSDMDHENHTISAIPFKEHFFNIYPIIEDLPDDILVIIFFKFISIIEGVSNF